MKNGRQTILRFPLIVGILCAVPLFGAGQSPRDGVSMVLTTAGSRACRLDGHFRVAASRQTVWDVLTDYDHLTQFVPSLRRSDVVERRPHGVVLRQKASARWWMFSRKVVVLLNVIEDPPSRISFEDVSHHDFEFYKGDWQILGTDKDLDVVYHLETKHEFALPSFLVRSVLKGNANTLLTDVRAEVLRRVKVMGASSKETKP